MNPVSRIALAVTGLVVVVFVVFASCSGSDPKGEPNGPGAPADVRVVATHAQFTANTIRDWKGIGDAVVLAQITASRTDTSGRNDPDTNGGITGRVVTVTVDTVLWQREAGFAPPASFDMNAWGTVVDGNHQQPIVARGEPRLEVNHVYLLALAKFPTGWGPLGDGAEAPFDGGRLGYGEWAGRDPDDDQPALDQLSGKNAAQLQGIIDATPADPRAAQYDDLDPLQRAQKLGLADS